MQCAAVENSCEHKKSSGREKSRFQREQTALSSRNPVSQRRNSRRLGSRRGCSVLREASDWPFKRSRKIEKIRQLKGLRENGGFSIALLDSPALPHLHLRAVAGTIEFAHRAAVASGMPGGLPPNSPEFDCSQPLPEKRALQSPHFCL